MNTVHGATYRAMHREYHPQMPVCVMNLVLR
jgi:hypothetical protein